MDLLIQDRVGNQKPGSVREYRKSPGSLRLAVAAAANLAKKSNERRVVIEGNSYMSRVFHICRPDESCTKYNGGMIVTTKVVVVEPDGEVFYATIFPGK